MESYNAIMSNLNGEFDADAWSDGSLDLPLPVVRNAWTLQQEGLVAPLFGTASHLAISMHREHHMEA